MPIEYYIFLCLTLFSIGVIGVLTRRNAIIVFMCIELMLNAANLAFVTFARINSNLEGQVVAFFTMVVAACEVVVGLAIIVTIYRSRRSASRAPGRTRGGLGNRGMGQPGVSSRRGKQRQEPDATPMGRRHRGRDDLQAGQTDDGAVPVPRPHQLPVLRGRGVVGLCDGRPGHVGGPR